MKPRMNHQYRVKDLHFDNIVMFLIKNHKEYLTVLDILYLATKETLHSTPLHSTPLHSSLLHSAPLHSTPCCVLDILYLATREYGIPT